MNSGLLSVPRAIAQELRLWLTPVGCGLDWWGSEANVPKGWLIAAGQTLAINQYPRLAKMLGTTYGGDGVTTFGMPDMRGRVTVGKDNMGGSAANRVTSGGSGVDGATLGANGGAETVALITANLAAHNHGITDPQHTHTVTNGTLQVRNTGAALSAATSKTVTWSSATVSLVANSTGISTNNNGSGTAHQNMPPAIVCNYIIRAA